MKTEKIKAKIKAKYKFIRRFAELSGMNYADLQNVLARGHEDELEKLDKIVDATPDQIIKGRELTYQHQIEILNKIKDEYGNVKIFAIKHNFNQATITYILHTKRYKVSKTIRRICEIINYEL